MSTYATDRPIQEVRQHDAPFVADDPSDTSLEEVQQSDTPLATSTSSRKAQYKKEEETSHYKTETV